MTASTFRVRRGRRHDLSQVVAVLGARDDDRLRRLYGRILKDLRSDVYVAEEPGGEIVGIVALQYARSLVQGGMAAVLDGARARRVPAGPVLDDLVAFAEARARQRGCRRLCVWTETVDADLRATLLARGYRTGEMLMTELADGSVR